MKRGVRILYTYESSEFHCPGRIRSERAAPAGVEARTLRHSLRSKDTAPRFTLPRISASFLPANGGAPHTSSRLSSRLGIQSK